MRYTIIHREDSFSKDISQKLNQNLVHLGFEPSTSNPELVITIGGDGTMLHAIHHYLQQIDEVAFVGIHTGTLGFFTDYTCQEIDQFIRDIQQPPTLRKHRLIETNCYDQQQLRHTVFSLNEARVENIIHTQMIKVSINGEYLESFRGNGLCISGQLGSTAYNRSIQGAIIDSKLEALQLTEISGIHHHYYRSLNSPLILHPDTKITLENESFEGALLIYDYKNIALHKTKRLEISLSDKVVTFASYKKVSYFDRLRSLF